MIARPSAEEAIDSRLINKDLAPIPPGDRTWKLWHYVSLWVGMSVCIPPYMLAAVMIESGMTWRQSLLVIFLGNAIVLFPLVINGFEASFLEQGRIAEHVAAARAIDVASPGA